MKLRPEIKKQWTQALTNGSYKQGRHALKVVDQDGSNPTYCCLGVLCDLAHAAGVGNWVIEKEVIRQDAEDRFAHSYQVDGNARFGSLPDGVVRWAFEVAPEAEDDWGYDPVIDDQTLGGWNDNGNDFEFIAGLIERNL